jgi:hypothetical protein
MCVLTVHGLLHVTRDIRVCGPMWASWTFYMERFCGILQTGLRSRVQPWANLNRRILHMAYLQVLAAKYNVDDELYVVGSHDGDGPRRNETSYPECRLNS